VQIHQCVIVHWLWFERLNAIYCSGRIQQYTSTAVSATSIQRRRRPHRQSDASSPAMPPPCVVRVDMMRTCRAITADVRFQTVYFNDPVLPPPPPPCIRPGRMPSSSPSGLQCRTSAGNIIRCTTAVYRSHVRGADLTRRPSTSMQIGRLSTPTRLLLGPRCPVPGVRGWSLEIVIRRWRRQRRIPMQTGDCGDVALVEDTRRRKTRRRRTARTSQSIPRAPVVGVEIERASKRRRPERRLGSVSRVTNRPDPAARFGSVRLPDVRSIAGESASARDRRLFVGRVDERRRRGGNEHENSRTPQMERVDVSNTEPRPRR